MQTVKINVSKSVGWPSPEKDEITIPPVELIQSVLDKAVMDNYMSVAAIAVFLLTVWRYSPVPETDEERATLDLVAREYPRFRALAEREVTMEEALR